MILLIYFILVVLSLAGMWKMFEKAGEDGWKAIVPIYNLFIILKIIRKPWWWIILMIIPYIGFIWTVWSTNLLSKSFGKGAVTTVGLIFLPFIFYPLLGFGDAKYTPLKKFTGSMTDAMHKGVDDIEKATEEVKGKIVDVAHSVEEKFGEDKKEEDK